MRKILIAGGEPEWQAELRKLLPHLQVLRVDRGEEVLSLLSRNAIALVILDSRLPPPGLPQVVRDIRRMPELEHLPLFAIADSEDRENSLPESVTAPAVDQLFLHPIDLHELSSEISTRLGFPASGPVPATPQQQVSDALAVLWGRYRDTTLARVEVLENAATALLEGRLSDEEREAAERVAHKLAGALGTFGLSEGSRLARDIETLVRGLGGGGPGAMLQVAELVVALRTEVERGPGRLSPSGKAGRESPDVLIVDPDPDLADRIAAEALVRGVRAVALSSPSRAFEVVAAAPPSLIVTELRFPDENASGLDFLGRLRSEFPAVPVMVLTGQYRFTDRVEVARLGGLAFLQKPVSVSAVVDSVELAPWGIASAGARVLVVDDDPEVLQGLRDLLEPQRITVATLQNPTAFWDVLEAEFPDLLVLGEDLPGISVFELCRVVRSDPRWAVLPVVFLAEHTDSATVQEIFEAGADDYIWAPIVGPEAVSRIQNRLERSRLIRSIMETDPVTGLANRRRAVQSLTHYMRLARRHSQPLSIAMIRLDNREGEGGDSVHSAVDAALRSAANLLRRSYRAEDVIARWGTEELLLATFGMYRDEAASRVENVLRNLQQQEFSAPDGATMQATFSAGVAEYPVDGLDLQSVYRSAGEAQKAAHRTGPGKVMAYGWTQADASRMVDRVDVVVVEDDETIAKVLLHSLETAGYSFHAISDGEHAVRDLAGARPSIRARVILMDVDLPGLDGLSVLRQLAQDGVTSRSRVVMLTVRASEAEVLQSLELGAFDHVAKPFSVPILMQRLRRAIRA